jgi:chromosome segregation ATPase
MRARLQRKVYIIDSHATAEDVAAALAHASGAAAAPAAESREPSLREQLVAERAMFAEAVNRFREGDLDVATLVRDNAWLTREWSDARHARTLAGQRAQEAEARADAIEAAQDRLQDKLDERRLELAYTRSDLMRIIAELGEARTETQQTREQLQFANAENERHRLVLRTRIVAAALGLQRWLARWRRK